MCACTHPHTHAHMYSGAQLRAGLHKACSAVAQRQNFSGFRAGASGCTFLGNTAFCKGGLHGRRGQDCRMRCCPWSLHHGQMLGGQALRGKTECLDACLMLTCPQGQWERQTAPRSTVGGELTTSSRSRCPCSPPLAPRSQTGSCAGPCECFWTTRGLGGSADRPFLAGCATLWPPTPPTQGSSLGL